MSEPVAPIERPGMGGYFAYLNLPAAPVVEIEQQDIEQAEGGEQSSPDGMDSSTSSSATETNSEPGQTPRRRLARTTARR